MRLVVLGGSGFLGRELCSVARADGCEVVQVGHSSTLGHSLEIRDPHAVSALVREHAPTAVVNLAYVQDGPDAWAVNVEGTRNAARAAVVAGCRFVQMSTDVVFDGRKGTPYVESDPPAPCTAYGRTKAEAERVVRALAPQALVVRTSLIVGGPDHEPSKHEVAALDPEGSFYDDEIRSPVQVTDLARALVELVLVESDGILHVAGADDVTRADLAELVRGGPVRRVPAPAGRPLDCALDSSCARALLRVGLRGVRTVFA